MVGIDTEAAAMPEHTPAISCRGGGTGSAWKRNPLVGLMVRINQLGHLTPSGNHFADRSGGSGGRRLHAPDPVRALPDKTGLVTSTACGHSTLTRGRRQSRRHDACGPARDRPDPPAPERLTRPRPDMAPARRAVDWGPPCPDGDASRRAEDSVGRDQHASRRCRAGSGGRGAAGWPRRPGARSWGRSRTDGRCPSTRPRPFDCRGGGTWTAWERSFQRVVCSVIPTVGHHRPLERRVSAGRLRVGVRDEDVASLSPAAFSPDRLCR